MKAMNATKTSSTRNQRAQLQKGLRTAICGAFSGLNVGILIYCFVFMRYVNLYAFPKSMDDLYMKQPALMNHTIREAKAIALLIFPICSLLCSALSFVLSFSRDAWEKITVFNLLACFPLSCIFFVYFVFVPMYR